MPRETAGKSRITRQRRTSASDRARTDSHAIMTVQLEALKAIAIFEASVQPHGTSPSCEYMGVCIIYAGTKQNKTKRNGKHRFLRIMRAVAVLFFHGFLVKRNGIVLTDIGNILLTL